MTRRRSRSSAAPTTARPHELTAGASSRRGAAITIVGAPGVGKTALLRAVAPAGVRAIDVTAATTRAGYLTAPLRDERSARR